MAGSQCVKRGIFSSRVDGFERLSQTITEVSSNVQNTAQKAEESRELADRGAAVVGTTRAVIQSLQTTVHSISESVGELASESQKIASAAKIIEEIADQVFSDIDITKEDQLPSIAMVLDKILDDPIDVLINNAGLFTKSHPW